MIIFGLKFWAWGSALTNRVWRCAKCGYEGQFIQKKGMRFLTLYWVIPTIPLSGITNLIQCPNCKTRYEDKGDSPPPRPQGPYGGGSSMETHNTPPIALP